VQRDTQQKILQMLLVIILLNYTLENMQLTVRELQTQENVNIVSMVLIYQIQDAVQPITIGMPLHKVVRECGSKKMPLDVLNSTHPTTVLHVIMPMDSSWLVKAHSFVANRDITMILIN
jgi:hypothetical protein